MALSAVYVCPEEPFTGPGNIAWQSSDLATAGTVASPAVAFVGPGTPAKICLYLDRHANGSDHYLLAAYADFTENSLPNPAETFDAIISDPVPPRATACARWRHWVYRRWFRTAQRSRVG